MTEAELRTMEARAKEVVNYRGFKSVMMRGDAKWVAKDVLRLIARVRELEGR